MKGNKNVQRVRPIHAIIFSDKKIIHLQAQCPQELSKRETLSIWIILI